MVLRPGSIVLPYEESESTQDAILAKLGKILQRTDEFYKAIAPKGVDLPSIRLPGHFSYICPGKKKREWNFKRAAWIRNERVNLVSGGGWN